MRDVPLDGQVERGLKRFPRAPIELVTNFARIDVVPLPPARIILRISASVVPSRWLKSDETSVAPPIFNGRRGIASIPFTAR